MLVHVHQGSNPTGAAAPGHNAAAQAQATPDSPNGGANLRRAPGTGTWAAVAMWKLTASAVTLFAALFYGLGRLQVDGFYSHLDTTASAAGVNTISIIEPAAIIGALVALFATAILLLLDIFQRWLHAIRMNRGKSAGLFATAVAIAGAVILILYFKLLNDFTSVVDLSFALSILVAFVVAFGAQILRWRIRASAVKDSSRDVESEIQDKAAEAGAAAGATAGARAGAEAGEQDAVQAAGDAQAEVQAGAVAGATAGAAAGAAAGAKAGEEVAARLLEALSGLRPRVAVVGIASMIIIGLCVGFHHWGVYDANKVKKGIPVQVDEAGFDLSSIGAIRVSLQPVDASPEVKSISASKCLLEIGQGPNDLIIYDASIHEAYSVPATEVVVTDLKSATPCAS